jgi:hypothetical protein
MASARATGSVRPLSILPANTVDVEGMQNVACSPLSRKRARSSSTSRIFSDASIPTPSAPASR